MTPETVSRACSQLDRLTAILGSDADIPAILDALDELPHLFSVLNQDISRRRGDATDLSRVRTAFLDLQQALLHVDKRLQREHRSILLQVRELSAQQEWAQLSRQSG